MHKDESRTDLGTIKIHKNVIASISSLACLEIEGVKKVGGIFLSGLMELIGQKPLLAIKVEVNKNGEVKIGIPLIIKYGFNIPETANKAQESVRQALDKMTNLPIKDIDISVQGIERG